jgi:CelD/BcsL family acetyltransferase involved in cellulose biosynthesis
VRIVLHRAIPDDDGLRCQWNHLVQQMERPEVFYTYEWAWAVYRAYKAQMIPLLLLAYEEGVLVGLVALATNHSQETVFLAGATADYCDFICHPLRRPEFLEVVFAELKAQAVGALRLANLPADSATAQALEQAVRNAGYSVFSRPAYSCAQVAIDFPEGRKIVKESVQRRMRRYSKALGEKAPVTVSHSKSFGDITAELAVFEKAHVARFLATGRISNLARRERRLFLDELTRSLSNCGWVTLSRLLVKGQAVAWNYGFQFAGSWFWYQPTFATDFQQYSPGLWLLSKIVEESCEDAELTRIDLGLGAEGYKDRLATSTRHTLHAIVTLSRFRCWKERVRHHSVVAVRSVPRLEAWARTGMRLASSLKSRLKSAGLSGNLKSFFGCAQRLLRERSEFLFLNWSPEEYLRTRCSPSHPTMIESVDLDLLATAAMLYIEEPDTLEYLLRAAQRLRSGEGRGFVLMNSEGLPVHFCWTADFENCTAPEWKRPIKAPRSNCALIVDAWTPVSVRGHGYYREAIACVASRLQEEGKSAWIFTEASNGGVLRGAETSGFVKMFSFLHQRSLFASKVVESRFSPSIESAAEVSSAA